MSDERSKLDTKIRRVVEIAGSEREAAKLLHISYNGLLAFLAGARVREATVALLEKYVDEAEEGAKKKRAEAKLAKAAS